MVAKCSRRSLVCVLALVSTSACSNPASEAPIALTPGMYDIKIGSFGKARERMCFSASDADNFDRVLRKHYFFTAECSHKADERVGNALKGTIQCPIDPTTGWDTSYAGHVAAEQLTINAKVVNYVVEGSPSEREEIATEGQLTATRVGNCS